MTLYEGGLVVISPERSMDPVHIWELVARERVNFLVIVGDAMGRPLVEAVDRLDPSVDLSGLVLLLSGGAILSPAVKRALAEKLPHTAVIDGFGSSEAGGQGQMVATADGDVPAAAALSRRARHDGADRGLPPGRGRRRRQARAPWPHPDRVLQGPRRRSAQTFPVVDGVRWSVPGDDARIETDGTITVLGRGSVSINTGGEKVYPEEVEGALKRNPAVFDAVVVGVPDERWGERVVAVVAAARRRRRAVARRARRGCPPTPRGLQGAARRGLRRPRRALALGQTRLPLGEADRHAPPRNHRTAGHPRALKRRARHTLRPARSRSFCWVGASSGTVPLGPSPNAPLPAIIGAIGSMPS